MEGEEWGRRRGSSLFDHSASRKAKEKNSFGLVGFVGLLQGCSSRALGVSPPVTDAFLALEKLLSKSRRYSTLLLLLKWLIALCHLGKKDENIQSDCTQKWGRSQNPLSQPDHRIGNIICDCSSRGLGETPCSPVPTGLVDLLEWVQRRASH